MEMAKNCQFLNTVAQNIVLVAIKENNKRLKLLDEEEEMDNHYLALMMNNVCTAGITERSVWRHPTSNDWWENIFPNLTDDMFRAHFRVDRTIFKWLVTELHDDLFTMDTKYREAVSVEKKVAVSLKCLATTCDLLTIASLFGLGRSSVHQYFLKFVNAMYEKVVQKAIKFPTKDEIVKKASEFEEMWGFPMAFAAIDGSHIPFNPPVSLATDFHNYKGWRSVIVVAMCDAKGKVLWIKSGIPGRMSDSGAFKSSSCYQKLSLGDLQPNSNRTISGTTIPYLVLGDSGFAMESWLVKPFTFHGQLTEKQKIFNYRHSRARRAVENLFGRAKQRWRRLLRGLDVTYENAHKVISVCFALHNICEEYNVEISTSAEEVAENHNLESRYPQPASSSNSVNSSGAETRNILMEYFSNQPNPWRG